uniref:BPTI/Kunitz inhibitor domain-containing protein n=1 Tax=Acrobeloides nanus TaxID=290746 RepID=A0A914DYU3_9BILA
MASRSALFSCIISIYFLSNFVDAIHPCLESKNSGDTSCGEPGGLKFFYDKVTKHCQPFQYAGCGGSLNRFDSAKECREKCTNVPEEEETSGGHGTLIHVPKCSTGVRAATDANIQPLKCDACPSGHECLNNLCCPTKEIVCNLNYDAGKFALVGSHTPRYFYDKKVNNCLLFTYYGVLGNANNFEIYNECMKFCSQ